MFTNGRRTPSDGNSSPDPSGEVSRELIKMKMEWCINLHRISLCDSTIIIPTCLLSTLTVIKF
jgi:hypothetical protein